MTEEITVRLQKCDERNKNGRIYPRDVMEKAIAEAKNRLPLMGMLGVPDGPTVPMAEVSHIVTDLSIDNEGYLTAKLKVLNTPKGQEAQQMVKDTAMAYRTAGVGMIDADTGIISEFMMTCVTVVPESTAS